MPSPFWKARDFKFQIKETASKIVHNGISILQEYSEKTQGKCEKLYPKCICKALKGPVGMLKSTIGTIMELHEVNG